MTHAFPVHRAEGYFHRKFIGLFLEEELIAEELAGAPSRNLLSRKHAGFPIDKFGSDMRVIAMIQDLPDCWCDSLHEK